jgi:Holliday junction resolvase RusA-like endonuclease
MRSKGGKFFTQEYKDPKQENREGNFKARLREELARQTLDIVLPTQVPVAVHVVARMPIPQSWGKRKRETAARERWPHASKPDADNIQKHIADCCNGVVWVDDKQVWSYSIEKRYSANPGYSIRIEIMETEVGKSAQAGMR